MSSYYPRLPLLSCIQLLEACRTDGNCDLTLQLKTEVPTDHGNLSHVLLLLLITCPLALTDHNVSSHSVLCPLWCFVAHRCRNCLVRQLSCGSRFKGQRRSFERHSGWWRGNSMRCVCVWGGGGVLAFLCVCSVVCVFGDT